MSKRPLSPSLTLSLAVLLSACGGAPDPAGPPAPAVTIQSHVAGDAGFRAASHLIAGARDAILVDAQFTRAEAGAVAAMVRASGRVLRVIFITHAHPDHYLGLEVLVREFPAARVLATPEVVADLRATAPAKLAYWKPKLGDQRADAFIAPEPLVGDTRELEGAELRDVRLGAGESEHAAALHVPSLRALVAGDLAFHDVHLWLAENRPDGWLANLAAVRALGAIDRVYPGHGGAGGPELLDDDAAYIRDFVAATDGARDAAAATGEVLRRYPGWALPIIAELSVAARVPAPPP